MIAILVSAGYGAFLFPLGARGDLRKKLVAVGAAVGALGVGLLWWFADLFDLNYLGRDPLPQVIVVGIGLTIFWLRVVRKRVAAKVIHTPLPAQRERYEGVRRKRAWFPSDPGDLVLTPHGFRFEHAARPLDFDREELHSILEAPSAVIFVTQTGRRHYFAKRSFDVVDTEALVAHVEGHRAAVHARCRLVDE